jgi:hypothetical protein
MHSDPLASNRFLVAWSALILALAPGAAPLRPLLKNPIVYWPALAGAALAAAFVARSLGPALRQALRARPWAVGLGLAGLAGLAGLQMIRTGAIPVERFHLVLFAVLGIGLARRAGRGLLAALHSLILCGLVATADELLQHILASRVGDWRDVLTDLGASGTGILFAQLLTSARGRPRPARLLLGAAALVFLATSLVSELRWGHTIPMPGGTFFSSYSPSRLRALSQSRNYLLSPPATDQDILRLKDRYFIEGLARLKQRNDWVQQGQFRLALFDNAVLETYFAPILDARAGRWSPAVAAFVTQQAQGTGPLAPTHGSSGPDRIPRLAAGLGLAAGLAAGGAGLSRRAREASVATAG